MPQQQQQYTGFYNEVNINKKRIVISLEKKEVLSVFILFFLVVVVVFSRSEQNKCGRAIGNEGRKRTVDRNGRH